MGLQRQNKDIQPTPKSTQQAFETICRLCYIALQRQSGGLNMTSNGNTAQKHLIKILTETHQHPKGAYIQAIKTAPTTEAAETIKRIYKKLKGD